LPTRRFKGSLDMPMSEFFFAFFRSSQSDDLQNLQLCTSKASKYLGRLERLFN
jgi:hypothetical protein